ncbi:MAG: hypothetical protein N4A33_08475 [Bacteriovoracaceae bacterium]|jgi:hypothetical protein|nr:hypothetical protein [Bacteriovoracaceae bacterium]
MKKLLVVLLGLGALTTFAGERMYCGITQSDNSLKESLGLYPRVEVESYNKSGATGIEFESLGNEYVTKSFSIYTSIFLKREILFSARLTQDDLSGKRVVQIKINQKRGKKYLELSRFRYYLNSTDLSSESVEYENIQIGVNLPNIRTRLNFNCYKY